MYAAVDDVGERRRLERALHDGVQQDLIAVSVRLQLARRAVESDAAEAQALLGQIREEVHAALDGVRKIANDLYPSLLDARGPAETLRGAVGAAQVEAGALERHPPEVEAAAYFCCEAVLEPEAVIRLWSEPGRLRLEVELPRRVDAARLAAARRYVEAAGGAFTSTSGRVSASIPG